MSDLQIVTRAYDSVTGKHPVPPTTTPPSAATGQQLEDLVTALRALEIPDPPLERAREIGGLVQDLSQDAALAAAALLNFARRAVDPTPTVPATLRARLGTETLSLADSLGRLGDFNLDEHWATGQTLGPGQAETVRKMLLAVVGDPRLVLARLAEQTVRARHARELPAKDRAQIALEIQELYAPLANRLGVWSLKWELEDLAFREQQPREYQRIAQALNEKRRDREQYIRIVLETLTTQLRMAGIEATVQGRPKHIYSIFRKMQRKQLPFEQVFDVRAARIIVPTVADCYAALGVVHDMWPFIPGEFDDYVATPKDNNYQSIHTAVHGPDGRPLEVQIRTQKMQDQAELGVAAHWRYKEGSNADRRYDQKILAIRQLIEGGGANSDELARISVGLFDDRIYAMTPKGEVVDLPKGGTPLDFAFHVHSNLGERCKGAKVNGRIAPLTHALKSGDVVEIITGKQPAPSRDWLSTTAGYLVSPRSRSKLRAYFRRLDEQSAQPAATTAEPRPAQAAAARSPRVRPAKTARSSRSPVAIDGVGDLPITLARCCGPVRPQPIRGYLTLGRGVTIHKADCPGLAHMLRQKPQRQLQVEWTDRDDVRLAARVQIEAFDRRGLLRDISDLIAEEHLSIEGVTSHTDPDNKIATFELRLAVKDVSELARLQRRLARIPNVYKVRRAR